MGVVKTTELENEIQNLKMCDTPNIGLCVKPLRPIAEIWRRTPKGQ